MFVVPSKCSVFIQNSLLVDRFGLTTFTAAAVVLLLAAAAVLYTFVVTTVLVPRGLMPTIITAATITDAAMIATAISCACFEVVIIFFRFMFFYLLSILVFI